MELSGAVCLVTGASSGIGRASALALATGGAVVAATGRSEEVLREIIGTAGGSFHRCDLLNDEERAALVRHVTARHGRVDVLVNCAGAGYAGAFPEMKADEIEILVRLNLTAAILLTREVLPAMLERRFGRIVNVASIVGYTGSPEEAVYSATKSGLVGFSHSLAQELAGTGVGVALVAPGAVDTPFFERRGRRYARSFPRLIGSGDAAQAVVAAAGGRSEVFAPGWMRFPARLSGAAPGLYRRIARRFF